MLFDVSFARDILTRLVLRRLLRLFPQSTTYTAGGVLFYGSAGAFAQDAANLFWDDTNNRLGVGNNIPSAKLSVTGASSAEDNIGIFQITTGTGANTDEKLTFGVNDGGYSWIQSVKPLTGYRNLVLNPNGGSVGVGINSPASLLDVGGSDNAHTILYGGNNDALPFLAVLSVLGTTWDTASHGFAWFYRGTDGNLQLERKGGAGAAAVLTVDRDSGDVTINEHLVIGETIKTLATTVASLPAAGTAGRRAFVTDANATTFASIVAGGGANGVPVYDDGTNWRIG